MNDSDRVPVIELIRRFFSGELAGRMNAIVERDRMAEEDRREKRAEDFIRQAPEPWI